MVNGGLNNYIRAQLQRGYTPEAIRTALIQAGYNPHDVDHALRVTGRSVKRHIEIRGRTVAMAIGGMLAILLLVVSGFLLFGSGPKDLEMAVRVQTPSVIPGEVLKFSTSFSSEQKREVPVSVDYAIYDVNTRRAVTSRSERLEVGASAFSSKSITLPKTTPPGEYELKVTARFERLTRVSTAKFTVPAPKVVEEIEEEFVEEEIEDEFLPAEPECPASCDDLNPATEDSCEAGQCVYRLLDNVCGNGVCEDGENRLVCPQDCGETQDKSVATEQALAIAVSDPEKAATICTSLVLPEHSDPCFTSIANVSGRSALCTNIQDLRARDNCLMEFAFRNDYSVCSQLSNRYLLTSCQSLARLASVSAQVEEIEQ